MFESLKEAIAKAKELVKGVETKDIPYNIEKLTKFEHEVHKAILYIDKNLKKQKEINPYFSMYNLKHSAEKYLRDNNSYYKNNIGDAYVSKIAMQLAFKVRGYKTIEIENTEVACANAEVIGADLSQYRKIF